MFQKKKYVDDILALINEISIKQCPTKMHSRGVFRTLNPLLDPFPRTNLETNMMWNRKLYFLIHQQIETTSPKKLISHKELTFICTKYQELMNNIHYLVNKICNNYSITKISEKKVRALRKGS